MTASVRLTLSQAQAEVSALRAEAPVVIDWTKPRETARRLWMLLSSCGHSPKVAETARILERYQSHLDFEAGRAFELAAVERARAVMYAAYIDPCAVDALDHFGAVLTAGLHHAEG